MPDQIALPLMGAPRHRVLTFDLETRFGADEVGGWSAVHRMGMACAVVHDSLENEFRTYGEEDVPKLIEDLGRGDLIVGFNHVNFDYRVLTGYSGFDFSSLPNFDILEDVSRILGHRLKLQSLAHATLGEGKSADGLQSLRWVKEGRLDLVRDYCRQDVDVTRRLFEFGAREGRVRYERYDELVWMNVDWDVARLVDAARKRAAKKPA